jgi:hypothetical protein
LLFCSHWINTMYRCVSLVAVAAIVACAPAAAQVQRNFPQNALRGTIAIGEAPAIVLNGEPARLAPGARIRNQANLLETPSALLGQKFAAHYTLDLGGLVNQVWVLRGDELAKRPWPSTAEEASRWLFDPAAQAWSRP